MPPGAVPAWVTFRPRTSVLTLGRLSSGFGNSNVPVRTRASAAVEHQRASPLSPPPPSLNSSPPPPPPPSSSSPSTTRSIPSSSAPVGGLTAKPEPPSHQTQQTQQAQEDSSFLQDAVRQREAKQLFLRAIAATAPRHDWTRKEIAAIYYQPLMELTHQAVSFPSSLRYPVVVGDAGTNLSSPPIGL